MDNGVVIRLATTDDITGIVYVHATTWIAHYPNEELGITEADIKDIDWHNKQAMLKHSILSSDYQVWVAVSGVEILGFTSIANMPGKMILENLFVLPEHQGLGLGTQLLQTAIKDHDRVYLHVAKYLDDSIGFYNHHGFKTTGVRGEYKLPGGKCIPTIEMVRSNTSDEPISSTQSTLKNSDSNNKKDSSNQEDLISRKQLAKVSGVRDSTIKWYSEIGLLDFTQSETKRRRYFPQKTSLARLEEITDLRSKGYSLNDIKSLIR